MRIDASGNQGSATQLYVGTRLVCLPPVLIVPVAVVAKVCVPCVVSQVF